MDENNKVLLLEQALKNYKEVTNKELSSIQTSINEHEKRLLAIEQSKEKTDYQYEQIIKTLDTLNKVTIPNLTKEIEELKNKPVKRYDQAITGILGAIFGAVGTFIAQTILK